MKLVWEVATLLGYPVETGKFKIVLGNIEHH